MLAYTLNSTHPMVHIFLKLYVQRGFFYFERKYLFSATSKKQMLIFLKYKTA